MMKRILIEVTHAPYQPLDRARVGLELAMGLSAFDHQVSLLLTGQGLVNLHNITDTPAEAYHKTFAALPLYDVTLCVSQTEAIKNNLAETLPNEVMQLSDQAIATMKQQTDIVLCP